MSPTAGSAAPSPAPRPSGRRSPSAVTLLLLAACIPVLGLRTGSPAAQSLPAGSEARAHYDTVATAMGAGWTEPFEIVAVARRGAITTPQRLATLERAQRKLSRDPDVRAVLGPGTIARSAAKLRSDGRRAVPPESPRRAAPKGSCAVCIATCRRPPTAWSRYAARCRVPTPPPPSCRRVRATSMVASARCATAWRGRAAEHANWPRRSPTPGAARAG